MQIRKWYFAINHSGLIWYERLIKAAVVSCRKNTNLEPICLYYGEDHPVLDWLKSHSVRVIGHSSSLLDTITSTPPRGQWQPSIATGAYLRLDIPLLEQEDDFVLYTDSDIIFTGPLEYEGEQPEFFACAPEEKKENWQFFNSGVMIINVENMRRVHADFSKYAALRMNRIFTAGRGTYDQGVLNAYFAGLWSRLPLEYNWKPYWGINPEARILHFHGPKPDHLRALMQNKDDPNIPAVYRAFFAWNPEGCAHYAQRFDEIAALI